MEIWQAKFYPLAPCTTVVKCSKFFVKFKVLDLVLQDKLYIVLTDITSTGTVLFYRDLHVPQQVRISGHGPLKYGLQSEMRRARVLKPYSKCIRSYMHNAGHVLGYQKSIYLRAGKFLLRSYNAISQYKAIAPYII